MIRQHQTVLIMDFGSQYTQLIARRVRELGVYSEIAPCTLGLEMISRLPELEPGFSVQLLHDAAGEIPVSVDARTHRRSADGEL